jgi:hypothetical protein
MQTSVWLRMKPAANPTVAVVCLCRPSLRSVTRACTLTSCIQIAFERVLCARAPQSTEECPSNLLRAGGVCMSMVERVERVNGRLVEFAKIVSVRFGVRLMPRELNGLGTHASN